MKKIYVLKWTCIFFIFHILLFKYFKDKGRFVNLYFYIFKKKLSQPSHH